MTYEIYRYIFIGAAILCGIMFVVSVLLFILLKVPKLISDLSGRTAKKAIKSIREQNAASGNKAYKASAVNEARGKVTDKITPSGKVHKSGTTMGFGVNTAKIATQQLMQDGQSNETTVLDAGETSVLEAPVAETSVLTGVGAGETSVLTEVGAMETSVLSEVDPGATSVLEPEYASVDNMFAVEFEITYIHTNEIINAEAMR